MHTEKQEGNIPDKTVTIFHPGHPSSHGLQQAKDLAIVEFSLPQLLLQAAELHVRDGQDNLALYLYDSTEVAWGREAKFLGGTKISDDEDITLIDVNGDVEYNKVLD